MANTKSAKKAIRVTKRKAAINKKVKTSFKDVRRDIFKHLENGEVKEAVKLEPKFQSEIDKAVKKGVIKKNTGARYKSRVAAKLQAAQ